MYVHCSCLCIFSSPPAQSALVHQRTVTKGGVANVSMVWPKNFTQTNHVPTFPYDLWIPTPGVHLKQPTLTAADSSHIRADGYVVS